MYTLRHFDIRELVDPFIYQRFGADSIILFHEPALVMIDRFRDKFGPIKINDWHLGGSFHESGLRLPDTSTGARLSMHKYGMAFDSKPASCTPKDMSDYILAHPNEFPEVRRLEDVRVTKTWLHADTFGRPGTPILVVQP